MTRAEILEGLKVGDVDPRAIPEHCHTISDKALAVAGGVLEAIFVCFRRVVAAGPPSLFDA